jgi:acetyl esterase/lipase
MMPVMWMIGFAIVVVLSVGMASPIEAQSEPLPTPAKEIPIWPGVAPGSESWNQKEVGYLDAAKKKMVRNVVQPTLTAYLPERAKANGTAVIICPGGGFRFLSWQSEGTEVAEWLRDHGVAAFVLKYRLMDTGATEAEFQKSVAELFRSITERTSGKEPANPVQSIERMKIVSLAAADGRQAVKVVRQRAAEWGISPDRIGILGFSAGGMVTMGTVMEPDAESRPNFAAPIYGGSTGGAAVPKDAPPLFILCADDDALMAAGSAKLYLEWKAANKSAELHIYSKGGHGFGMNKRGLPIDQWIEHFGKWLEVQGLLKITRS